MNARDSRFATRLVAAAPALVSVLCVGLVSSLAAGNPVRVIAALLLVTVLPGLAASVALGVWSRVSAGERIVLVPALSLALSVLVSVALYGLGVRLSLGSWADSLAAVTVLACLYVVVRPPASLALPWWSLWRGLPWIAASAVVLTVAGVISAHSVARADRASRFTTLWVLPASGDSDHVRIGLYNHQGATEDYVVKVGRGRQLRVLTGVRTRSSVSWTRVIRIPPGQGKLRVVVTLGIASNPVYRQVALTVAPTRGP